MNRNLLITLMVATMSGPLAAEKPGAEVGIVTEKPTKGIFVEVDGKYMVPYKARIPGSEATFEMVPVPGGEFLMGSPEDEEGREPSEGPQVKVKVAPMWVGKHEVKWNEYDNFRLLYQAFTEFEIQGERTVNEDNKVDSVTAPTPLYEPPHTFEYGHDPEQPAVTMTQYSAQQYTKWLSKITGQQYRLPCEAEWEYACRAGTTTAYNWGDDADEVEEHAWTFDNATDGQELVGQKPANAFGLHDMHGNVAELTVNSFTEDGYGELKGKQPVDAMDTIKWPKETADAIVARGGHWQSEEVSELRSAARLASDDEEWKDPDPQVPMSPWWFSEDPARGVGMRLFRSYQPLDDALIEKFWDNLADDAADDVNSRLNFGNGKRGLANKDLPAAVEELDLSLPE